MRSLHLFWISGLSNPCSFSSIHPCILSLVVRQINKRWWIWEKKCLQSWSLNCGPHTLQSNSNTTTPLWRPFVCIELENCQIFQLLNFFLVFVKFKFINFGTRTSKGNLLLKEYYPTSLKGSSGPSKFSLTLTLFLTFTNGSPLHEEPSKPWSHKN